MWAEFASLASSASPSAVTFFCGHDNLPSFSIVLLIFTHLEVMGRTRGQTSIGQVLVKCFLLAGIEISIIEEISVKSTILKRLKERFCVSFLLE